MKKTFFWAMGFLALSWNLSLGDPQVNKARYLGNPRINPGTEPAWHNYNGRGPSAFPGTPHFLDSSGNQYWIYNSRIVRISSNGANVVGIVLRQMVPSTNWIELCTSTDTGVTWMIDPCFMQVRNAHIDFTAPDRYGFLTAGWSYPDSGAWYIRNSGGYGSGQWDAGCEICPLAVQNVQGTWVGNYLICVPMEQITGGIPLISEVIDTLGNVVSDIQTVFDQYGGTADCRDGKVACFGGGPTDGMNIKTSTDGGITWVPDSMGIWALSSDSVWWEYNNVILQDGSVGVLVTMDQTGHLWDGHNTPHGTLQFFRHNALPPNNKTTIFTPTMDQACTFPMLSRKGDNTVVATFMYVASGWDSIAWASGQTMWDIGESHSTNGGLTWSAVRNLTNTPSISECCPHLARYIGSNEKLHIMYGTRANTSDPPDIYWNAEFAGGAQETYNWYMRDSVALGVEAQQPEGQRFISNDLGPVFPNPLRGLGTIAYQLPKPGKTTLVVYNSLGQRVRTLIDGVEPAGRFRVVWDGRDGSEVAVPSGIYFFRLSSAGFSSVRKVVVAR